MTAKFPVPLSGTTREAPGMTRSLLFAAALLVLTVACHDAPTQPADPKPRSCLAWSAPESVTVQGFPPGTTATLRRCLILGR